MFAKLFFVISTVVVAYATQAADKYPAGVNPALCPNYPHCDNTLLAAAQSGAHYAGAYPVGAYTPAATTYAGPGAYAGYAGFGAHGAYAGAHGAYAGAAGAYAAPGYPAGVNPASCPNYPYCTNYAPGAYHAAAPLPGFAARLYPDGVNPATCPNYPYCH